MKAVVDQIVAETYEGLTVPSRTRPPVGVRSDSAIAAARLFA